MTDQDKVAKLKEIVLDLCILKSGLPTSLDTSTSIVLIRNLVQDQSKFDLVLEALIEFITKILELFFNKDNEFKKPGIFKYFAIAKAVIDLVVKVWRIF